jgi:hypothetical protein
MPTISIIFGTDHFPPHFHAYYGEFDGLIDIKKLEMIKGNLPNKALELILEWAKELVVDWNLCQEKQHPNKMELL